MTLITNSIAPRLVRTPWAALGVALFACAGTDGSATTVVSGGAAGIGGHTELARSSGGSIAFGGSLGLLSGTTGGMAATGGISTGGTRAEDATGGRSAAGGNIADGGAAQASGGNGSRTGGRTSSGGASTTGGRTSSGGSSAAGGSRASGGLVGTGGTSGAGGSKSVGGTQASGGARAGGGTAQIGGSGGATSASCPYVGHVTYTLSKSSNPTAAELNAYDLITAAMDKAVSYYNCYTNITKTLNVSYVASVSTADGNINGSIRFGSSTTYMDYRTAMHEISHTVGIGTASKWASCVDMTNKLYTCSNGKQQLASINGQLTSPADTTLHADNQHFWPYGINQQSEVKSEADLIYHCQMVMAILKDLA